MSKFSLPDVPVSKDLIERIQFSVSSRNAEAKVSECGSHIFGARYAANASDVHWQYVASGVVCLLRSKELVKGGKKHAWSVSLCLYNATYGVLVWKGNLASSCNYTDVADNFHVCELTEVNSLIGILFTDRLQAGEHSRTYRSWHDERVREERGKGSNTSPQQQSAPRFYKEMISRPCNFQHIQGTQAIDECLEIDRIKSDIHTTIWGLAPRGQAESGPGRRSGSHSNKRKKELAKPRLEFSRIEVPQTMGPVGYQPPSTSPVLSSPALCAGEGAYPGDVGGAALPFTTEPQTVPYEQNQLPLSDDAPLFSPPPPLEYGVPYTPGSPRYNQTSENAPGSPRYNQLGSPQYDQVGINPSTSPPFNYLGGNVPGSPPYNSLAGNGPGSPQYDQLGGIVGSYHDPTPGTTSPPHFDPSSSPAAANQFGYQVPGSPPVVNGYPHNEGYQPYHPPQPTSPNGLHGYGEAQGLNSHLSVDSEVQHYMGGGGGGDYRLDLTPTPPGRLSPLNLDKEFGVDMLTTTHVNSLTSV